MQDSGKRLVIICFLVLFAGCGSPPVSIPFPHAKHVVEHGISCQYCHPFAEQSASAGLPSVKKCMDCHSFLKNRQPELKPLFDAWETQRALRWPKLNNLPDHVVFTHQAHLKAGIACRDCHGDVENDRPATPLTMTQCLACHHQHEAPRNCSTCHK